MPHVLLVDFKLNEDGKEATIVEFGCGINSSYEGYAAIHGKQGDIMYRNIFRDLGQSYQKVIMGAKSPAMGAQLQGAIGKLVSEGMDPAKFPIQEVGKYCGMGQSRYLPLAKLSQDVQDYLKKLTPNDCVVFPGKDSLDCMSYAHELDKDLKENGVRTNVINSSSSIIGLAKNKVLYKLFGGDQHLATQFLRLNAPDQTKIDKVMAMPSDKIVIKPTNSAGGSGVIVIDKKDLPKYLRFLNWLLSTNYPGSGFYNPGIPCNVINQRAKELDIDIGHKSMEYWRDMNHRSNPNRNFILLQEFKKGKLVDGYDPTGRMVFVVDGPKIRFIDGYWKLPAYQEKDAVSDSKKYVSDVHQGDGSEFSLPLSAEDRLAIETSLLPTLQMIIGKAEQMPLAAHLQAMAEGPDRDISAYAALLRSEFAGILPEALPAPAAALLSDAGFFASAKPAAIEESQALVNEQPNPEP